VIDFALLGTMPGLPLLAAVYGNLLEIAVLTAASVLLGSFTTPAMSALGTVALYLSGHATETLLDYLAVPGNEGLEIPVKIIYYAVPNLTDFNFRLAASFGDPVGAGTLVAATAYAAVWCFLLLAAAGLLFRGRELP